MERQLSVEPHGECYHLRFHNYMGPWEGHQIEERLQLEEVEPPEGGEDFASVLGENQAYLWHEMAPDPDLHALITADRLPALAALVRDKDVNVLEGEENLPEPPPVEHQPVVESEEAASYIEYIDKRHESVWHRGKKAIFSALLIRIVPAILIALVLLVVSRHIGDSHQEASLGQVFARAAQPFPEQSTLESILSPDNSHLMRHRITVIRFAEGELMLVGDGSLLRWKGLGDIEGIVRTAASRRLPLVIDVRAGNGRVQVERVDCGNQTLARNFELVREKKLAPSDEEPSRGSYGGEETFRILSTIPWSVTDSDEIDSMVGELVSVRGTIESEDSSLVVRNVEGVGIDLDLSDCSLRLREFVEFFAPVSGEITIDMKILEVYPWIDEDEPQHSRKAREVLGRGEVYSASVENHHVVDHLPGS